MSAQPVSSEAMGGKWWKPAKDTRLQVGTRYKQEGKHVHGNAGRKLTPEHKAKIVRKPKLDTAVLPTPTALPMVTLPRVTLDRASFASMMGAIKARDASRNEELKLRTEAENRERAAVRVQAEAKTGRVATPDKAAQRKHDSAARNARRKRAAMDHLFSMAGDRIPAWLQERLAEEKRFRPHALRLYLFLLQQWDAGKQLEFTDAFIESRGNVGLDLHLLKSARLQLASVGMVRTTEIGTKVQRAVDGDRNTTWIVWRYELLDIHTPANQPEAGQESGAATRIATADGVIR